MTELVTTGRLDYTQLEPMTPAEGGWEPIEGDADVRFRTLCENDQVWAGIAVVQPCKFRYPHDHPGTIQLLEGEATVTCDGRTFDLSAGEAVFFLPGTTSEWEVKTPMREFFVAYTPPVENSH
jgi:uncharacterized cupin superfamily protein